jgi:membrane glycosyltransferase
VIQILSGRDSGWQAQRRDDGTLPLRDLARRYGWYTAFGLLLAFAAYEVSFSLFAWMTPVIAGLILAIPLAQWTASPSAGRALRRIGLLRVPEETQPPQILMRANELVPTFARAAPTVGALAALLSDPPLLEAHRALLPEAPSRRRGDVDVALVVGLAKLEGCATLAEADALLTRQEKMALLCDARGLDRLAALEGN